MPGAPYDELLDAHEIHFWWDELKGPLTAEIEASLNAWRRTVPFIRIGNGDYIALQITDEPDRMPVVYLGHEEPEWAVTLLSPTFDQFLADWERLCYAGPEIWLLSEFLANEGRGPLDVKQERVQQWRDIFLGAK